MEKEPQAIRRLGLDLGVKSIGWCLLNYEQATNAYELVDMGSRIWQSKSTKADRRSHRMSRRQRKHLKSRLEKLKTILDKAGFPKTQKLERGKQCLFSLRAKALEHELNPHELREILFHIAKNRGFKKSEKDSENQSLKKGFSERISKTEQEVEQDGGTYSSWLIKNKKKFRLRVSSKSSDSNSHYPTRELIVEEFEKIRKTQEGFHNTLNWDQLKDILFFQRSYNAQKIGKCSLFYEEERLKKNDPLSLEFVILEKLSHLKLESVHNKDSRTLTKDEISSILDDLDKEKEIDNSSVLKKLGLETGYKIKSKDPQKNTKIPGMKSSPEGYLKFSRKALELIIERFWSSDKCIGEIIKELEKENCKVLGLQDHLKYYGEVMSSVSNFYLIPPCSCSELKNCTHQISAEEKKWGKSPNGDLHVAFNQLRHLINAIIKKYGKIDEIVVELVRSAWDPWDEKTENQKKKEKEKIKKFLEDHSVVNNHNNKTKAKLFFEFKTAKLEPSCPYCGESISKENLFTSDIQIEHVIPYKFSKSNALNQLVLAHRHCNSAKGDKTPFEAFGHKPNYEELVSKLPSHKQRLFTKDALKRHEELTEGWLPNSLINTSFIAKQARKYLQSITDKVYATRGSITKDLRFHFGINKDRSVDDHHATDAFCIALISSSTLQKLNYYDWEKARFPGLLCSNEDELIQSVQQKKIIVSKRANHAIQGQINKATVWGIDLSGPEKKYRTKDPENPGYKYKKETASDIIEIGPNAYESGEYAYADLWVNINNPNKGELELIMLKDAMEIKSGKKPPNIQPIQKEGTKKQKFKKAYRIHKSDYLSDRNGNIYLVKQFDATPRLHLKQLKNGEITRKKASPLLKAGFFPIHIDILGHIKKGTPKILCEIT